MELVKPLLTFEALLGSLQIGPDLMALNTPTTYYASCMYTPKGKSVLEGHKSFPESPSQSFQLLLLEIFVSVQSPKEIKGRNWLVSFQNLLTTILKSPVHN